MKRRRKPSTDPKTADESAFSGFGLIPPTKNPKGLQKIAEPPGFFCYTLSPRFVRVEAKVPKSFVFVTESSQRPLIGYLIPAGITGEIVPAIRVEIDGSWNTNPHCLVSGSMTISLGHLRCSAVANWSERFPLNEHWIIKLWSRIHRRLKHLNSNDYVKELEPSGYDYYPISQIHQGLTDTERRYIAIVSLWSYWKKHPSKEESKCDDLKILGMTKRSSGAKKGGKAVGEQISKGAFTTIANRAGVPK